MPTPALFSSQLIGGEETSSPRNARCCEGSVATAWRTNTCWSRRTAQVSGPGLAGEPAPVDGGGLLGVVGLRLTEPMPRATDHTRPYSSTTLCHAR
jgi:hypothetical protein